MCDAIDIRSSNVEFMEFPQQNTLFDTLRTDQTHMATQHNGRGAFFFGRSIWFLISNKYGYSNSSFEPTQLQHQLNGFN